MGEKWATVALHKFPGQISPFAHTFPTQLSYLSYITVDVSLKYNGPWPEVPLNVLQSFGSTYISIDTNVRRGWVGYYRQITDGPRSDFTFVWLEFFERVTHSAEVVISKPFSHGPILKLITGSH